MKARFLITALCFSAFVSNAQIVLEHTFTIENSSSSQTGAFNTANETMYSNFDNTTNIINIFNADFTLYKSITIIPLSGYNKVTNPSFLSTKLFNDDNLIEFIVIFYNLDNNDRKMILGHL